jgi:hypothetical protein
MEAKAITTSFSNITLTTHRKKVIAEETKKRRIDRV